VFAGVDRRFAFYLHAREPAKAFSTIG